jgi:hypothetical protein
VSSRAFARGLQWWLPTMACSDLQSSQVVVYTGGDFWLDPLEWLRMRGVKNPKGFGFYL